MSQKFVFILSPYDFILVFIYLSIKKNKAINKDKVLRDIRTLLESDDYHEPKKTVNAFSDKYIECEINGDKNKSLSVKEYLNKTRPYQPSEKQPSEKQSSKKQP